MVWAGITAKHSSFNNIYIFLFIKVKVYNLLSHALQAEVIKMEIVAFSSLKEFVCGAKDRILEVWASFASTVK